MGKHRTSAEDMRAPPPADELPHVADVSEQGVWGTGGNLPEVWQLTYEKGSNSYYIYVIDTQPIQLCSQNYYKRFQTLLKYFKNEKSVL
jgi:hypothetical protein